MMRILRTKSAAGVLLAVLVTAALTSCGGMENPDANLTVEAGGAAWTAYRDGDGAWQVLAGEARYVLELGHPEGRYSVAHVCAAGLDEGAGEEGTGEEVAREVTVSLLHATLAARPNAPTPCATETEGETEETDFYALSGTVSGLEAGETGLVYSAFSADAVTPDAPGYSLAGFAAGEHDLLVTVRTGQETPSAEATPPSEVLVRRGVAVKGDAALNLTSAKPRRRRSGAWTSRA